MKEVICINDKFDKEPAEFFSMHGVTLPEKGKIYHVREVVNHTINKVGLRLEEIVNPRVPTAHPILGMINIEPSFCQTRFSLLNGDMVTVDSLAEEIKQLA